MPGPASQPPSLLSFTCPRSPAPVTFRVPPSLILQLDDEYTKAEEHAKKDISSMVFNTFIWCQVGARQGRSHALQAVASAGPALLGLRATAPGADRRAAWACRRPPLPRSPAHAPASSLPARPTPHPPPRQMFNMINARKVEDELNVFQGIFNSHIFWIVWVVIVICQVRGRRWRRAGFVAGSVAPFARGALSGTTAAAPTPCTRLTFDSAPAPARSCSSCSSWAASSRSST